MADCVDNGLQLVLRVLTVGLISYSGTVGDNLKTVDPNDEAEWKPTGDQGGI
jgi:hypothetical protein